MNKKNSSLGKTPGLDFLTVIILIGASGNISVSCIMGTFNCIKNR